MEESRRKSERIVEKKWRESGDSGEEMERVGDIGKELDIYRGLQL